MSHAPKADKLPMEPAADARPAPPHTRGQIIPKARTKRPVTRRVTRGTTTNQAGNHPRQTNPTRLTVTRGTGEAPVRASCKLDASVR